MPQFMVYRNRNPQTHSSIPYLLDVQNDLLSDLDTRLVVPLSPASEVRRRVQPLMPVLEIDEERLVMLTPLLAGVPRSELGSPVALVEQHRFEIIAAIDFLLTGI